MKIITISIALILSFASLHGAAQNRSDDKYVSDEAIDKVLPWKFPIIPDQGGRYNWAAGPERDAIDKNLLVFFGDATGNYVDLLNWVSDKSVKRRSNLLEQFNIASVRPDHAYLLPNGNRILFSFQHNDVGTRSIIVTSGNSTQVLATALIHRFCVRDNFRDLKKEPNGRLPGCDKNPTMTIFYSGRTAPNAELNAQLNEFAMRYVQRYNFRNASGKKIEKLATEVRVLDENKG